MLPVDIVKLDQTFVARLADSARDRAIVGGVIALAHAIDLAVIAEGVERELEAAVLAELGCDMAQGYRFARPGPVLVAPAVDAARVDHAPSAAGTSSWYGGSTTATTARRRRGSGGAAEVRVDLDVLRRYDDPTATIVLRFAEAILRRRHDLNGPSRPFAGSTSTPRQRRPARRPSALLRDLVERGIVDASV